MKANIILEGRPASKKNSRRNFGHISLPSKAYEAFRESALWQLKTVKARFDSPVSISVHFQQKGRLKQDLDNAIASIGDVLQESGILADDTLIEEIHATKKGGFKDWKTEITIEPLVVNGDGR